MERQLRITLIAVAQKYAHIAECAMSTVSRKVRNDPAFFTRLGDERKSFTVRTFDDVMCWFADHWPIEHQMPLELMKWIAESGYQNEGRTA